MQHSLAAAAKHRMRQCSIRPSMDVSEHGRMFCLCSQRKAEIKRNQKRELLQQKRAQRASFDGLIQAMVGDGPRGRPRSKLGGPGGEGGEGGDGTGVGESRELTPDGGAAQDQLAAYGPIIDIYADRCVCPSGASYGMTHMTHAAWCGQ